MLSRGLARIRVTSKIIVIAFVWLEILVQSSPVDSTLLYSTFHRLDGSFALHAYNYIAFVFRTSCIVVFIA
jgi:hypothetical protein